MTSFSSRPVAGTVSPAALRPAPGSNALAGPLCFVVDDDRSVRQVLKLALAGAGVRCQEFADVPALLAALGAGMPDLVILDISLDGSDAVEGIRGLTERGYRGMLQIMSGLDLKTIEDVSRIGERHGFRMLPVMRKPFRAEALNRLVRQYLSGAAARAAGPAPTSAPAEPQVDAVSLEELLRANRIEVWYQPKFDLRARTLAGAECLARGRHPKGVLLPGVFLPGADEHSMLKLTERVLTAALADWPEFAAAGSPMRLAVNVPVACLMRPEIPVLVREHRPKDANWPGLILEVTEDQVLRDIALAHEMATQLRIYGISLAIDDFGAGYSHLARLRDIPFVELKLDRHLVSNCAADSTNAALCQTAIDIAHRFGSLAVGEGIETAAELQSLHRMGCDLGQGFLLARPMPRDQMVAMLRGQPVQRA